MDQVEWNTRVQEIRKLPKEEHNKELNKLYVQIVQDAKKKRR